MHIFIHSQSQKAQIEVNKPQVVTTDWVISCLEGQRAGGWKQLVCSYILTTASLKTSFISSFSSWFHFLNEILHGINCNW